MRRPARQTHIAANFDRGRQSHRNGGGHYRQWQARLTRGRLFRQPRHMNKAATDFLPTKFVHQAVENMITDKGSRGLRHTGRQATLLQRSHDSLNWQRGPISDGARAGDHRIDRLLPRVIRNPCVIEVERHALGRDVGAPTRLAQTNN